MIRTNYWSEKFQTLVYEGAEDLIEKRVEIYDSLTSRFLGYQTTDEEWQGD